MISEFEQKFKDAGFKKPTAIQKAVAQPLADGKDVIGLAPTGSGKTLAYAWPLMEKIVPQNGTQLVALAPSQELAMQITDVIRDWCKLVDLRVTPIIGGANVKRQMEKLKKHPEIVVGTPGRVLNLIHKRKLKMHKVQAIVIDEADRLLDEEKLPLCRKIVSHALSDVQLAFFSATDGPILHHIHQWFGVEPQICDVREKDDSHGHVDHYLIEVPTRKRADALRRLAHVKGMQALVFFNQTASLMEIGAKLEHDHVKAVVLSGEEGKEKRARALKSFRQGKAVFLLTTDIAARGLDIPGLKAVINYDLPRDLTTYIHRTGRTGRMGASGEVINLGNEHDLREFKKLMRAEGVPAQKGYLFKNQIVTEKPNYKHFNKKSHPAKKRNNKQGKKKHKKKRLRRQKNKGKRKKG